MAKVLLINSNRFKHPWPVIPFGLCYIATVLETDGNNEVHFLDLCFSSDCKEDIQKAIRCFVPDVIGISIRNIDDTCNLVHYAWRPGRNPGNRSGDHEYNRRSCLKMGYAVKQN